MSRPLLLRVLLGVALGTLGIYAWKQIFPSEEARIRRQLDAVVDAANESSNDPSGIAAAARLATYFTDDVTIDPGAGMPPLRGRETVLAASRTLRPSAGATRVDVRNADVTIAPDGNSAAVTLTVTVTRDTGSGANTLDARELAITMIKRDSVWLIAHVTIVDTLR